MARKEKIEAEIEFKPKGLAELKGKWADFAGDLLEPMVLLAAGATKAQAAWAGLRGVFESRVLGPLGLVAGASIGFLATTRMLVGKWKELGMVASGTLERMTLQFRPLLGSLDRARERVKELQSFAVETPFEIEEIVEANKMLETLTQGALANREGMTLVGDSASVAGQAYADVARQVGRLYDGLMSGRPVGEATMRLQEMGIISGTVRNQIESMQAANASGLEIWKVVEKQLARNKGAMDAQSKSLEGLQSTWNDTKRAMEGGFADGFLEGEKKGVEASIKLMEAMSPVMRNLGAEVGRASNWWEGFKLRTVEAATENRAFGGTVEWVIKGVVGLAAIFAGAASASILAFTAKMLGLVVGSKKAAEALQYEAAVAGSTVSAKTKLRAVLEQLTGAYRANAAGLKAEAGAHMTTAAAQTRNLVSTNGLVTAVKVGRGALMGMGMAVRFVGAQLKVMLLGMATNPLVWLAAAVYAVTAAISKWSQVQKEAKERLDGYLRSTDALASGMRKQIAEIRTVVDLRQAEAKVMGELLGAYKDLDAARPGPMRAAAQERVRVLQDQLGKLPGTRGLERDAAAVDRERAMREGERDKREYERDSMAAKGPEDALRIASERLDEIRNKREAALRLAEEEAMVEERAAQARQQNVDVEVERQRLTAERARLENEIAKLQEKLDGAFFQSDNDPQRKMLEKWIQNLRGPLAEVNAQLKALGDSPELERLNELLGSNSEVQQIKAKIEAIDNLTAAVTALNEAESSAAQGADEDKGRLAEQVAAAREAEARARKLAEQAGVADVDARGRQDLVIRRDELEARRTEDVDPMREAQAAKDKQDAELAVITARLDAEAAVAALRMRGFEREEKLLDIERQKLEARKEAQRIGEDEYVRQKDLLTARQDAMERERNERTRDLRDGYEGEKLRQQEAAAMRDGDPATAQAVRDAQDRLELARVEREARREAEEGGLGSSYVGDRMAQARAGIEERRRREAEDAAMGRGRVQAGQAMSYADLQAQVMGGREARRAKEEAARKQDEIDRKEAERRYRDMGMTAESAANAANEDVKLTQAQRMMQELNRGSGSVVASSLARAGGGGGVAGVDVAQGTRERMLRVLEEIRDKDKTDIDLEILP